MTVDAAYIFLKLPPDADEAAVAASYRRLVKDYHPDRNLKRPAWSHEMMFLLNEAVAVVKEHRRSRSAPAAGPAARPAPATAEQALHSTFRIIADDIFQGIHTYYNYGLENVHLRADGSHKFRYRSSVKRLRDGIQRLKAVLDGPGDEQTKERARLLHDFTRAFLQNMLIEKFFIPDGRPAYHKASQHYRQGSEMLDRSIKAAFFREDFADAKHSDSLALSEHEFMTILVKFHDSEWLPETIIKIHLIEVFNRLVVHLRRSGVGLP